MPTTPPPVEPCLDCRDESTNIASLVGIVNEAFGTSTASQAKVTVAGANVAVLPQESYQSVYIKNTGTTVVWIRLASGAASTGANGEIPLAGESSAGAGDGGDLTIDTFTGVITAACATSGSVSVTWST